MFGFLCLMGKLGDYGLDNFLRVPFLGLLWISGFWTLFFFFFI